MASGDTLLILDALDGVPGDADNATLTTILTASADEPDQVIPVLAFDPGSTEEHTFFRSVMPRNYGGGGLTVTIYWSSDATSGNVIWSLAFKSVTADVDDLDSKAFAAENDSAADATASAAGEITETTITFTDGADMDSVAAGEMFMLDLHRSSAAGGDTMNSNDAEFHCMEIRET